MKRHQIAQHGGFHSINVHATNNDEDYQKLNEDVRGQLYIINDTLMKYSLIMMTRKSALLKRSML